MLNKEVSKTYQIQIRQWREIQKILFMIWPILSPHADAQQNFRIFWVGLHSRSIEHHFVSCCIACVIFKHAYCAPAQLLKKLDLPRAVDQLVFLILKFFQYLLL